MCANSRSFQPLQNIVSQVCKILISKITCILSNNPRSIHHLYTLSNMSNDIYTTPLTGRYSSPEMQGLFSQRKRFSIWRQLWLWLAESQQELGLPISDEALEQMRGALVVQDEEFKVIAEEEQRRRFVPTRRDLERNFDQDHSSLLCRLTQHE